MKQLAEAPVVKKSAAEALRDGLSGKPELLKPLTALGVDPLKDVDTLTAAGSGLPEDKQALLIVRGRFDAEKLRKTAQGLVKDQPTAWKASKEGDVTVYELRDKAGQVQANLVFVGDGTVLVSTDRKYRDGRRGPRPEEAGEGVRGAPQAGGKGRREGRPVAGVGDSAARPQAAGQVAVHGRHRRRRDRVHGAAEGATKDLKIAFSVHTKRKKTAEEVAGLLEAAKGFASIGAESIDGIGPLLSALVDACKTSTDGGTATLAGELSAEQVAKAVKKK